MSDRAHDERPGDAGDGGNGEEPLDDSLREFPALAELGERLAAYYRAADAKGAAAWRRRWRPALPRHARAVAAIGLSLLFAGAAAAAVTLSVRSSAPLSGRVPPVAKTASAGWGFGFTEAGSRYRIAFAPMLTAGDAGWSSFLYIGRAGRRGGIATPGGYPTVDMPLLPGAGNYQSAGAPSGRIVHYALTGPSVAAVQVGAEAIRTRASVTLPTGDRIAVFTLPAADGHPRSSPRTRSRRRHATPLPPHPATRLHMIPLDRHGEPIARSGSAESPPRLPTRLWRRGSSGPAASVGGAPHRLPAGACTLVQHGLPALIPQQAEVALALRPINGALGELMLSCLQITYSLHGSALRAAILLNARRPGGAPPGPIPGAKPVKGRPGIVDAKLGPAPGDITARREGETWLVVQGEGSLHQRLQALDALRIGRVSAPVGGRASPAKLARTAHAPAPRRTRAHP